MKIGLVVPGFSADAGDWCIPALRNLARQLATTEEVHVLALRYPHRPGDYAVFGARVRALGGGRRRGRGSVAVWRRALSSLAAEHRRRKFDVLHAFWATETGAVACLAGRVLGVPTVVSLAGGEPVALRDIGYGGQLAATERLKARLALRLASLVTAGSDYQLALAAPWLRSRPPGRARRIPLGVDLELFRPGVPPLAGGPPVLVHVASLVPVKDQATLLEAAAGLQRRGVAFQLEIVGEGALEPALRALAARLGIAPLVRFRGAVPHDALPAIYQSGTLFVLSSRHEAQGMAALEAAACGLPVVGAGVGVIPELAPQAALAVPCRDPEALADALAAVLHDRERRCALGRAARAHVEAEFGLHRSVERFRQVYASLAGRG